MATSGHRGGLWGRVAALAERQHGVIGLSQLLAIGLSESAVHHAVAAGRLHRIHRGVYAVGRGDLTQRGHWMAAVLACGPGAVLSYAAAAALHGIRPSAASRIDVTVMRRSSLRRNRIRVHNHPELTPADVTVIDDLPVTSLPRTLLDLAVRHREDQVERACHQAVVLRVFDMRAMEELLQRSHGRRGIKRLRTVLARRSGRERPGQRP